MENELNSWALDFEDTLYSLLKSYMESKVRGIKVTQDEQEIGWHRNIPDAFSQQSV